MEDKIEVGEYVRNESGYIHKVDSFDKLTNFFKDEDGKLKEWVGEDVWGNTIAEIIVKHSKNIIDLIEKYEFANERLIIDIDRKNNKICLLEPFDDRNLSNSFVVWHDIKEIKSIVTKEQFNFIKYEIE